MFYGRLLNKTLNAAFHFPSRGVIQKMKKHFPCAFFDTRRRKRRNRKFNKLSRLPEFAGGVDSMPKNKPSSLKPWHISCISVEPIDVNSSLRALDNVLWSAKKEYNKQHVMKGVN